MDDARKRIVVVAKAFPVLSQTFVVDHVLGLARAGFEVIVVARTIDAEAARRLNSVPELSLVALRSWRRHSPWRLAKYALMATRWMISHPALLLSGLAWRRTVFAQRLHDALEPLTPDLVHAHFGPLGVEAAIALGDGHTPLIVNFHGFDVTAVPVEHGWAIYRTVLANCTLVAHSQFVEQRLRSAGFHRIERVTLGVDQRIFRPRPRDESWPRPLRLISIGRLAPQKGHDLALGVVAILRRDHPELDARLHIVGAGPESSALRLLAANLKIQEFVEGPEPLNYTEVAHALSNADIAVVASRTMPDGRQEAFCRVAIEAMACGIPVVATPCGGLADTVGIGGRIAESEDAESLSQATREVIARGGPNAWAQRALSSSSPYSLDRMDEDYREMTLRHLGINGHGGFRSSGAPYPTEADS